jgi:uncharacterized protein involved in response to NO
LRVEVAGTSKSVGRFGYFWDAPHKPLFLASFVWALIAILWWPLGVRIGLPPPAFEFPALWHAHELLFGTAGAAVAGYLLTALPGWIQRPPVGGKILKVIVILWILARFTTAVANHLPPPVTIAINSGYFFWLAGYIFYQFIAARAFRKAGFCVALVALGLGDALLLNAALSGQPEVGLSVARATILVFAIMMTVIASRAIPAFTQNWMRQTLNKNTTIRFAPVSRTLALCCLAAALVLSLAQRPYESSFALIGAALLLLWNARRWRSVSALSNPLLAAMHLAFLWLPIGLVAIGLTRLFPGVYLEVDAIHAITIGAMSGLIMAIAGRAAAHRVNGVMHAGKGFVGGVVAIWVTTCLRLAAPVFPAYSAEIITLAGAVWSLGWAVYISGFLRVLKIPTIRPVLSGAKHNAANEVQRRP